MQRVEILNSINRNDRLGNFKTNDLSNFQMDNFRKFQLKIVKFTEFSNNVETLII